MPLQNRHNSNVKRYFHRYNRNKYLPSQLQNNSNKNGLVSEIVDLAKSFVGLITWQLLIVIILILFYAPIKRMINVLPEKFEKSNEVSVWSLSFKIQEQAKASGYAELANIIQGLSPKALQKLLSLGNFPYKLVGDDRDVEENFNYYLSDVEVYKELAAKELITSDEDLSEFEKWFNSFNPIEGRINANLLTTEQKKRITKNSISLSDKGKQAYGIIIKVVSDSIADKQ